MIICHGDFDVTVKSEYWSRGYFLPGVQPQMFERAEARETKKSFAIIKNNRYGRGNHSSKLQVENGEFFDVPKKIRSVQTF